MRVAVNYNMKTITLYGVKLHYSESGLKERQPVIIMHGWGCSHKTMTSIESMLADKLHIYNIDLPGHGESDEPNFEWGVDEYTTIIEQFIENLHIKSPIIIGHSFGGRIGILLASRRDDIRKMVLIDAAGIKPSRTWRYYFKVYSYKFVKKVFPYLIGPKRASVIVNKYRRKTGSSDYNEATPVMRGVMSKCVNEDLKYAMPNIKCPTLLIWGDNDTTTPISDARIMEKMIPNAGLVSLHQCGHFSFLENQIGFRAVLKEFLKKELT